MYFITHYIKSGERERERERYCGRRYLLHYKAWKRENLRNYDCMQSCIYLFEVLEYKMHVLNLGNNFTTSLTPSIIRKLKIRPV